MASTFQEYTINFQDELGSGTFGSVYIAQRKRDKIDVAVKRINLFQGGIRKRKIHEMASKELAILQKLQDHPNVVRLLGQHEDDKTLWIFMELCNLGNLAKFMGDNDPDMRQRLKIMHQCADAVHFMHSNRPKIIHRDIKPTNVLMKSIGDDVAVKVSDFGLGKIIEDVDIGHGETMKTLAGTKAFMGPEFFRHIEDGETFEYHPAIDTFSLGLLFQTVILHSTENSSMVPKAGNKTHTFINPSYVVTSKLITFNIFQYSITEII